MLLNTFSEKDLFPTMLHLSKDFQDKEGNDFILKVYYALLSYTDLSKDSQQLCIYKPEILRLLQITPETLEHALFNLKRQGYLELIRLTLRLYSNRVRVPKYLNDQIEGIKAKLSHFRKITPNENTLSCSKNLKESNHV